MRDLIAEIVVRRARKIAGKNYSREVFDDQQSVTFNLPGGRTETFKLVNFEGRPEMIGQIVAVEITDANTFSLVGRVLENQN